MENFIKKYVNISILILSIIFISAVYKAQDFQLDASSDTLILENDQDLKNFREVSKEYSSKDFLLITVTSKTRIINQENIDFIGNLSNTISKLNWVDSVQSILDAPVLKSGNQTLTDLATRQLTLKSDGLVFAEVEQEFIDSPIFSELIISKDGKTSGIIINIKNNEAYSNIVERRNDLKSILLPSDSDKEKLNIIVSNNGVDTPIETVSGGEFSRIQTAILLAIRTLLSKLGGSSVNLLFLDEVTGVLDDEGKEKLIEVLSEDDDLNVFLISHDFTHPLIDKISIVKENNISSIQ